jgi:hypothetical protein
MFNPLVDNFSKLSDNEVEEKISELGRKYWMTRNPEVQMQISTILEMYKSEANVRRAIEYNRQKNEQNGESGLDSLINVS